jgi:hypothetical protein
MQLIEIVRVGSGQDELDEDDDDDEESTISLTPGHSPAASSLVQNFVTRGPNNGTHKSASTPFPLNDKGSAELQFKLRQLELDAEERKLRLQAETEERKIRIELERQQHELDRARERELRHAELERERERELKHAELEREREIRAHELTLRQLEINNSGPSAASLAATRPSTFKAEAAVKLIPRLNENDIESFYAVLRELRN